MPDWNFVGLSTSFNLGPFVDKHNVAQLKMSRFLPLPGPGGNHQNRI